MEANRIFHRTVAKKHRMALAIILALVLFNFFAMQMIINLQENDSPIVNLSGQQRMLSQKISLHILTLEQLQDNDARSFHIAQLDEAIQQFEQNHKTLLQDVPLLGPVLNNKSMQARYFSGSPSLNDKVNQFLQWARHKLEFGRAAKIAPFSATELESLLHDLDAVVVGFESEARQNITYLEWFVYFISVAMVLTLWLKSRLVFTPLEAKIKQVIEQLSQEKEAAKALKEKAQKANEAKSQFLTNMSHELRTPLNGVFGMLDLAIEQQGEFAKDDLIRKAKRSGKQLLRIISDMLDISAIESNDHKIESANFSMTQVLDECLAPIAIICDQKHLKLNVNISDTMPEYLYGSGNKLRQIINNLLNNAVKFTDSGFITFTARNQLLYDSILIYIEISDSGIGMTTDQQKSVFVPYHQGDTSSTRKYDGTGLGLSIVVELVQRMGGQLKMESEYGRGSKFSIKLPFKSASMPSERQQEIAKYASQYDLSHKKVAVVDDLAISRQFILHQLTVLNVHGDFFSSGADLFKSDINQYDVFIIDLNMPGMNGDEVATRLKPKLSPLKNQKLILISASEDNLEDYQASHQKFDFHFTKPLEESRFFDALVASLLPNAANHDPSSYNILIAEDNDINAHIAKQFLVSMGYNVFRVCDGQEAIDICNDPNSHFDLILMDINMPRVDGYKATNVIRGNLGLTIPIIALTANAFDADIQKSLALGMNKHLVKPLTKDKLQQAVKSCLGEAINAN